MGTSTYTPPQSRNHHQSTTPEERVFSETLDNVDIGFEAASDDPIIDNETVVSATAEVGYDAEQRYAILEELSQRGHRIARMRTTKLADSHNFSLPQ